MMAQGFDPAAATAAYLAQLPAEAHAKATAYTQGGHWLLLWGTLVSVAVGWLVLRSGLLPRVRDWIEARKTRPWLAVLAVVGVNAVLEFLLSLPWSAYSDWWRERSYGLTSQAFGGWLGESALMALISIPFLALLLGGVYALIRRTPRTWWLWSGGLVSLFFLFVLVISPVLIMPLFNRYEEAPAGAMRDAIVQMARENGVPSDKIYIYDGSKQSNRYTANVSGLFGTARIAMSDVMFAKGADLSEVRAVVGHEMGHYKRNDIYILAGAFGLLALLAFFVVDRMFQPVLRWTGAKNVKGLADPAGLPVIGMIMSVLALLGTPVVSSLVRFGETGADRYSLEHVNEPDGLAKALVKTIEYRAATPSRLEETLFYDHPSVGSRVRMAMEWKARQSSAD